MTLSALDTAAVKTITTASGFLFIWFACFAVVVIARGRYERTHRLALPIRKARTYAEIVRRPMDTDESEMERGRRG